MTLNIARDVNETGSRRVSKIFLEYKKNISRQREIEKANVHQMSAVNAACNLMLLLLFFSVSTIRAGHRC